MMSTTNNPSDENPQSSVAEAWREAGAQLEALGLSLATAFRAAWESEENRQHLYSLQTGLESLASQVETAVKETISSPEGKKAQSDLEKAAEQARSAIIRAGKELKKKLNDIGETTHTDEESY
ncbi:MAG: hypothetical protein JXA42_07210 [Anaerolineales bacterium]|nr:hypothetical protein [Anaerolineales bacterium]